MTKNALIFGAGSGISAAFARRLSKDGYKVTLAARDTAKLAALAAEINATTFAADSTSVDQVKSVFEALDRSPDPLDIVLYNASRRVRGPTIDLDPALVADAINVTAFGGFLVAQQAAKRMIPRGTGTIMFTGAS